jgi:tripartite-type tricarboxylate transporter receptor subunit TctC
MRSRMAEIGLDPVGSTPEQYQQFIRSEIEKWAKVVKFSGLKIE